jgi:hypothetical protein
MQTMEFSYPNCHFFSGLHRNKADPIYQLLQPFLVTVFFTFCTTLHHTVHMNSITELVNLQTPHLTMCYSTILVSVAYFRIEVLWYAMQCPTQWTA